MSVKLLPKSKPFWLLIVALVFAMQAGVKYIWKSDTDLDSSRRWLIEQNDLTSKIGSIGDIQITKSIYFQGDASTSSYNDYTMLVLGERGKARVVVRAFTGGGQSGQFKLISVRIL